MSGNPIVITDLPLEILCEIAGYLGRADVAALAGTCRALREAARDAVWRGGFRPTEAGMLAIAANPDWVGEYGGLRRRGVDVAWGSLLPKAARLEFCECLRCLRAPRRPAAGRGVTRRDALAHRRLFDLGAFGRDADDCRRAGCGGDCGHGHGLLWSIWGYCVHRTTHGGAECGCLYCEMVGYDEYNQYDPHDDGGPYDVGGPYARWAGLETWLAAAAGAGPGVAAAWRARRGAATLADVEHCARFSSVLALEVAASCGQLRRAVALVEAGWRDGDWQQAARVLYGRRDPRSAALAAPLGPLDVEPGPWLVALLGWMGARRARSAVVKNGRTSGM